MEKIVSLLLLFIVTILNIRLLGGNVFIEFVAVVIYAIKIPPKNISLRGMIYKTIGMLVVMAISLTFDFINKVDIAFILCIWLGFLVGEVYWNSNFFIDKILDIIRRGKREKIGKMDWKEIENLTKRFINNEVEDLWEKRIEGATFEILCSQCKKEIGRYFCKVSTNSPVAISIGSTINIIGMNSTHRFCSKDCFTRFMLKRRDVPISRMEEFFISIGSWLKEKQRVSLQKLNKSYI